MTKTKVNKWLYRKVLQEWTSMGWEDSCQYDTNEPGWFKEWRDDRKAYRANGVTIRSIDRREPNPEHPFWQQD